MDTQIMWREKTGGESFLTDLTILYAKSYFRLRFFLYFLYKYIRHLVVRNTATIQYLYLTRFMSDIGGKTCFLLVLILCSKKYAAVLYCTVHTQCTLWHKKGNLEEIEKVLKSKYKMTSFLKNDRKLVSRYQRCIFSIIIIA